jgi:folate-binding protein YgfZ
MTAPDPTADYLALRGDGGAVVLDRDVVRVSGPDAVGFLQGQLSADVAGLAPGSSTWSLLLQPQGRLDAWLRVTRTAAEDVLLDVEGGWGDPVATRLNRFKIRTKATIELVEGWRCVALRAAPGRLAALGDLGGAFTLTLPVVWAGLDALDLLGPDAAPPPGVRACGLDAYHSVRIEAGVPAMGAELDERTIPAEAGIVEGSVSWTKGCYTGQELVARIDSRGSNVPRRLRGVRVGTNVLPPPGATVVVGGDEVGRLTSVGESLTLRAPVALAYVGRAVTPPADAVLRWNGAEAPARIEELPLASG